MQKLLLSAAIAACLVSIPRIACAQEADSLKYSDPNPFYEYDAGMASDKAWPMAVEWNLANRDGIEKETADPVLAACTESREAARALLANVKSAYSADAMVLTKIAAASQYVMRSGPGWWNIAAWFSESPREIWTAALLEAAESAKDPYVATFMLDQLRWCGYPGQAQSVVAIGAKSGDRALQEFAAVVAGELCR